MNSQFSLDTQYAGLPNSTLVYDSEKISTALDDLSERLNRRMKGTNPVVLCVMNGALIFSGHLLTRLNFECELDYIHATRYRNTTEGNKLKWLSYPKTSLKNRTILILDDILDEGITLAAIKAYCISEGASKVEMAVLLEKNHDRCCMNLDEEFVALQVEDEYVFGFGMDYEGRFRHLNAIYALQT